MAMRDDTVTDVFIWTSFRVCAPKARFGSLPIRCPTAIRISVSNSEERTNLREQRLGGDLGAAFRRSQAEKAARRARQWRHPYPRCKTAAGLQKRPSGGSRCHAQQY